jgi:hypothetical protein
MDVIRKVSDYFLLEIIPEDPLELDKMSGIASNLSQDQGLEWIASSDGASLTVASVYSHEKSSYAHIITCTKDPNPLELAACAAEST